nr:hypothetical protein [Asanoa siamensis]
MRSLAFGADGRVFGAGKGVRSWPAGATTPDWAALETLEIRALAISPDRSTLAVAARDRAIHLWRLGPSGLPASEQPDQRLVGHDGPIGGLAFAPDGRTLASSGAVKQIRIWGPTLDTPVERGKLDWSVA